MLVHIGMRTREVALSIVCVALVGCAPFCLGHASVKNEYVTTAEHAGTIVAPPWLGLPASLAGAATQSCGVDERTCMLHPESCTNLCVALQAGAPPSTESPDPVALFVSIAMANLPYPGAVTLPRADTNVSLGVINGPHPETLSANSGTVSLFLWKDNLVVLFDAAATMSTGEELAIRGGRYAELDGHDEPYCASGD
jgi:hypothetical protein